MALSSTESFFYIGIDFGTTASGVAWISTEEGGANDLTVIRSWPGGNAIKVPTTIKYHKDGQKSWGFEAAPDDPETLQWFKLLLVEEQHLPEDIRSCDYLKDARKALKDAGKTAQQVVTDYLALLWGRTLEILKSSYPSTVVNAFPFRVMITVPATWMDYAVDRLDQAATGAGIRASRPCGATNLNIVSEPEAATFATMVDHQARQIEVTDEIFVMCDAGGGTVDLITYEMRDSYQMEIDEVVEGVGHTCGSIFIDEEMERCMKIWLGHRWEKLSQHQKNSFRTGKWNDIKSRFHGNEYDPYTLEIGKPSLRDSILRKKSHLPISNGLVKIDSNHMKMIFSPVIKEIMRLVHDQVQGTVKKRYRKPKIIVLVGGLGSNKYLYNLLNDTYPDIDIIQGGDERPMTAVCRGAALKARSHATRTQPYSDDPNQDPIRDPVGSVTSRVARFSYGISYMTPFEESTHHPGDKIWHEPSGKHLAANQMQWYIVKGDDVRELDRPSYVWRRRFRGSLPGNRFNVQVWRCPLPNPPSSRRGVSDIEKFISITINIRTPFNQLPISDNPSFREIVFQLDLLLNGPKPQFVAWVNGKECGRKDLNVSYISPMSAPVMEAEESLGLLSIT